MNLWDDKRIFDAMTRSGESIYKIRDHMRDRIDELEDPKAQKFFRAMKNRLLYETQWEKWQLLQYKKLLQLTDREAKDVYLTTGFATAAAIALGYYDNPDITVVFKDLPDVIPSSQTMAWNAWGINVVSEDFRKFTYPKSDIWVNTILSDMGMWTENEILRSYEDDPSQVTFDLDVLRNLPSGQECAWSWPYGGSRLTFGLMFEYTHPYWHNPQALLERWGEVIDIECYKKVHLPSNEKLELNPTPGTRHSVMHRETSALLVKGVRI